jgi:tetratricopeptide (TPR) repeat protein
VEGTVRRSGDRVRVTVRLINPEEGCHLWNERYDRQMIDVLSLQEEIADTVAGQLKLKLRVGADSHSRQPRTQSIEAYDNFLKGRFFWNKRTNRNLQKAEECFKLALKHDPEFAAALAGLANCYVLQGTYTEKTPQEVFPLAKDMVLKALALDPGLAEAHCAAGHIHAVYDWDWRASERAFQRALELDPNHATAHQWYGFFCLTPQRRFAEALVHLQLAREIEPLSFALIAIGAFAAYYHRRYDDAIRDCLRVLEMDSNFGLARMVMGEAYTGKCMYSEAIAQLKLAADHTERWPMCVAALGYAQGMAGLNKEAGLALDELRQRSATQYISPVFMAQVAMGMQNEDDTWKYLEQALDLRASELIYLSVGPVFDSVRSRPQFGAICRRVGLPGQAWE